jgi:hypothetical protein
MKKIIVTKEQFNKIFEIKQDSRINKHLLIEELSISEEVKNLSDYIIKLIDSNLSIKNYIIKNQGFVGELKIEFSPIIVNNKNEIKNEELICLCDTTNIYIKDNKLFGGRLSLKHPVMNKHLIQSGMFNLSKSIFHEVEHLYQRYRVKLSNRETTKTIFKQDNFYEKIKSGLISNNRYLQYISQVFYICTTDEQNAFTHETYKFIVDNIHNFPENELKEQSDLGKQLSFINYMYNEVYSWNENDMDYNSILEAKNHYYDNSVSFSQFKHNIMVKTYNAIRIIENKLNHAYKKAVKDSNTTTPPLKENKMIRNNVLSYDSHFYEKSLSSLKEKRNKFKTTLSTLENNTVELLPEEKIECKLNGNFCKKAVVENKIYYYFNKSNDIWSISKNMEDISEQINSLKPKFK